jgi:hypothetical protein
MTVAFRAYYYQGIPCHNIGQNWKVKEWPPCNNEAVIPGNMLIFVAKIRWGNSSTMVLKCEN